MKRVLVLGLVSRIKTVHPFSYEDFPGIEFARCEEGYLCISASYAMLIPKPEQSGLYVFLQREFGSAEVIRKEMGKYIKLHRGATSVFEEAAPPIAQHA
ncbi:MAG: hypothetical protein AAFQ92_29450 [Bacteroidota bacterium]